MTGSDLSRRIAPRALPQSAQFRCGVAQRADARPEEQPPGLESAEFELWVAPLYAYLIPSAALREAAVPSNLSSARAVQPRMKTESWPTVVPARRKMRCRNTTPPPACWSKQCTRRQD